MRLSLITRPLLAATLITLLALSAAFGVVRPARAAEALSVTLICGSQGGGGFVCVASSSGGIQPHAYTWTTLSNATIIGRTDSTNSSVVQGSCTVNRWSSLSVTVKDVLGATTSATKTFYCSSVGLPPPPPLP